MWVLICRFIGRPAEMPVRTTSSFHRFDTALFATSFHLHGLSTAIAPPAAVSVIDDLNHISELTDATIRISSTNVRSLSGDRTYLLSRRAISFKSNARHSLFSAVSPMTELTSQNSRKAWLKALLLLVVQALLSLARLKMKLPNRTLANEIHSLELEKSSLEQ